MISFSFSHFHNESAQSDFVMNGIIHRKLGGGILFTHFIFTVCLFNAQSHRKTFVLSQDIVQEVEAEIFAMFFQM